MDCTNFGHLDSESVEVVRKKLEAAPTWRVDGAHDDAKEPSRQVPDNAL